MGILANNQISALLSLGADAMDNMFDIVIEPPAGITTFENVGAGRAGVTAFNDPQFKHDITIRANGFSPPKFNAKTYEVKYKTVTLDRPSTKIEGKREFEIEFRLDANYQAYRFLGAWRSLIMQPSSGFATNALYGEEGDNTTGKSNINKVFGTITVSALARPIFMSDGAPFEAQGVTVGKFTEGSLKVVSDAATIPSSNQLNSWVFKQVWISALSEPDYKTDGGDAVKIKATFKFGEFIDPIFDQFGNI
jgi:hypothetical protein